MRSLDLTPFKPAKWARSAHAQTILAHYLPSPELPANGERLVMPLEDGDSLSLRYFAGTSDTVLYAFHGLGGCIRSGYMARLAHLAQSRGHSIYLVNHRGCGDGEALARLPYHSGRGDDLGAVLDYGRRRHPGKRHVAIGFSLSGNALLSLITGVVKGRALPDAAFVVNAPIDLRAVAVSLERGWNRMYDIQFVRALKRSLRRRFVQGWIDEPPRFPRRMSLRRFDEIYTGPVAGFGNGEGYYMRCSTAAHLHRIEIPTIVLMSEDDPFIPVKPYFEATLSPMVTLHVEKHGGHMGYLSARATPLGNRRWLDYALDHGIENLRARLL